MPMLKKYVKYHNDGTLWAKGTMSDGVPQGYWEWFRKDGSKMRSGYFAKESKRGNGPPMTGAEKFTK